VADLEELGTFYLGRPVGTPEGAVLYDSTDLVTHAVCVGMTGSGKTGLCIDLIEEAALDGVPAILIDPKGDLGNLLLTFPDLAPADFEPWVDPAAAAREGLDVPAFAAKEAARWREGLAGWGLDGARIARLRAAADFAIYTPGSDAGLPISVLQSLAPPVDAGDAEGLADAVATTATGLLALLGIDADPLRSREHILLATILQDAWSKGQSLDLPALITRVQDPGVERIGVLDLETFFPAGERFELAMAINNLLAAPGFDRWLHGDPLDVDRLLFTQEGRPRVAIVSIAHLSDAERMFLVTLLLQAVLGWVRRQAGTTSLRAILYLDEVLGFMPPVAEPPSKRPLLTLLKQARAAGLGVVLATQNPVDLDYKGLANAGTWLVGRLQTERDRERLLDGLAGAARGLDRSAASEAIAGLGKRQFLLHDVHEDEPVVLESRWAMSYLAGPLTREGIQRLMAPRRDTATATAPAPAPAAPAPAAPATPATPAATGPAMAPALPPDVPRCFLPVRNGRPEGASLDYGVGVLGAAKVRVYRESLDLDQEAEVAYLAPLDGATGLDWEAAAALALSTDELEQAAADGAVAIATPPAQAARAKSYAAWQRELVTFLARSQDVTLLRSRRLDLVSQPGEHERAFRLRLAQASRERRDAAVARLRQRYTPRVATLEERIRKAEQAVERERGQQRAAGLDAAISFGATVLGSFLGRKRTSVGRAASVLRGAGRTANQRDDVERAEETVEALRGRLDALQQEFAAEVAALELVDPQTEELEAVVVRPKKADVDVRLVALAFAPYWRDAAGVRVPAWTT
jgi:hypothetical protein